ncbi:hypothetical protein [Janibacter sp. HTCC2649]|uniref:hypothetical protein n=1 Tax=Janibacter sp. HTCC2649 TaxID=313589 RepID=UPI000322BF5A|nr:hypothetical protein [Janibacter sp. HTCC2649]
MGFFRRIIVLVVAMSAMLGVTAVSATASSRDRSLELIQEETGKSANAVGAGLTAPSGHTFTASKARDGSSRRTWVQPEGEGFRLLAELREGDSEVTFRDITPKGLSIIENAAGRFEVVADDTSETVSEIQAPWAVDATGRQLSTWFEAAGRDGLRQKVDTKGAQYPIVVDPWVSVGWYYTHPVVFVEMSWSETWALKNQILTDYSMAPGLLCGYVPTVTGRIACAGVWLLIRADVRKTVDAAIAAKKCYKVRMPVGGGLVGYDSYYKTCRS